MKRQPRLTKCDEVLSEEELGLPIDIQAKAFFQAAKTLKKSKKLDDGFAIFFSYSPRTEMLINYDDLSIPYTFEDTSSKGKAYDLRQILLAKKELEEVAVLKVNIPQMELFEYSGGDVESLATYDNDVFEGAGRAKSVKAYMKAFETIQFGEAKDTKTEILKKFIKKYTKELKAHTEEYEKILIYKSEHFNEVIEKLEQKLDHGVNNIIKTIDINAEGLDHEDFVKSIDKHLNEIQKIEVEEKLDGLDEGDPNVVKGWNNVCKAANLGKIKTLYIPLDIKRPGYTKKNNVFSHAVKGSEQSNDIAKLLVNKVKKFGGKVEFLKDEDKKNVYAELRYTE